MDVNTFSRLLPVLEKTRLAFLQGWGEPLIHPEFFTLAALAKSAGCRIGTTTNAMLIDEKKADLLVEGGIDMVAFSLAGTGSGNDEMRPGTRFKAVLDAIRLVSERKKVASSPTPSIHVAYILLRSRLSDFSSLIDELTGTGVENIQVTTLDFLADAAMREETIVPATVNAYDDFCSWLENCRHEFLRHDIEMNYQVSFPGIKRDHCSENINRSFFVSADGSISPCVFSTLPADGVTCIRNSREHPYHRMVFGNINRDPIGRIWYSRKYRSFRRTFAAGKYMPFCKSCPKLYGVS